MKTLLTFILLLGLSFSALALGSSTTKDLATNFKNLSWESIETSRLKHSQHQASELLFDEKYKIYYLLYEGKWFYSYNPEESLWEEIISIPQSFTSIPEDKKFDFIRQSLTYLTENFTVSPLLTPKPYFYESYGNLFTPPQILPYRRADLSPLIQSFYAREFAVFEQSQFLFREWDTRLKLLERQRNPLFRDADFNRDTRVNKQQDSLRRYYLDNLRRSQNGSSLRTRPSSYLPRR